MAGAAFAEEQPVDVVDTISNAAPATFADAANVATADGGQFAIDAELPSTLISVPVDPAAGIVTTSPHSDMSLTIGLPFAGEASSAEVEGSGVVSYNNQNGSTTVPVVKEDGTVQINTIIENSDAPTRYDYPLSLPEGATIVSDEAGGYVISDEAQIIATIAAPWAKDANGVDVPTTYELNGTTLTQVVEHRGAGVAYPVVADPTYTSLWWGIAIKLTNAETRGLRDNLNLSYNAGATAMCAYVPTKLGTSACIVAAVIRLGTWQKPILDAARQGRCAQINYPYGSGPALWNVTNESC